ncbi:MAG: hypothetical protein FJW88_02840 [Actinobacteria bacterium]|nr:hypothetical protein [Actinomycetota bacterium]
MSARSKWLGVSCALPLARVLAVAACGGDDGGSSSGNGADTANETAASGSDDETAAAGTDLQFVTDGKVYALSYNDIALGSGTPKNHEAEVRALAEKIANEVG